MGIRASCGHDVKEIEDTYQIATKEWTIGEEGWSKAISYKSVCYSCKKDYEENNEILNNEQEENHWLSS
jgi:hypothetical protein